MFLHIKRVLKLSKKFIFAGAVIIICIFAAVFYCRRPSPISKTTFALNTAVTITLYGNYDESLIDACFDLCRQYELIFSRTDERSELYRLNASRSMEVSDELLELIKISLYYGELSDGKLDITIGEVSSMWNFQTDSPALPDSAELEEALSHVDWSKIEIEGNTVTIEDPKAVIDLGAVAKGYIADKLKEYLISQGVDRAIINLGGNILCVGKRSVSSDFVIGLQYPFESSETIATIGIDDMSVVTSGVYERCFTLDGTLYHHILDTDTGYPVMNGLVSVTIISENSVDGDALSTSVFALGLEDGLRLIDSLDGVYAVFITDDMQLHFSDGLLDRFSVDY